MLLSTTESYLSTKKNSYSASGRKHKSRSIDFRVLTSLAPVRQSLFAELMAKSEAKMREEGGESLQPRLSPRSSIGKDKDEMLFLADRLRSVSLSGISSRSEETVLAAFAKSVSALREILPSLDPSGARFALIAERYRTALPSAQAPSSIVALVCIRHLAMQSWIISCPRQSQVHVVRCFSLSRKQTERSRVRITQEVCGLLQGS